MKNLRICLIVVALCCFALIGTAVAASHKAQGKNKQKEVTLTEDLWVSDHLLKRGKYQFKFDAANSLLTIWRDGKSVAGVRVNVTMEERKAVHNSLSTTETPKGRALMAITFAGDNRRLTFEEPAAEATDE